MRLVRLDERLLVIGVAAGVLLFVTAQRLQKRSLALALCALAGWLIHG